MSHGSRVSFEGKFVVMDCVVLGGLGGGTEIWESKSPKFQNHAYKIKGPITKTAERCCVSRYMPVTSVFEKSYIQTD